VQTNIVAIRNLLRSRGIGCVVINLHRHRTSRDEEVYHPASGAAVLGFLLRLRYDIVHLHLGGAVTPRLLGLAFACTAVPGSKAVLTFHSGGYASSPEGRTAGRRTLRGFVFRRFDRVIVVNREMEDLFRRFGVPGERVRMIAPHPLVKQPAAALPGEIERFFAAHSPVLVTVGLLEPEYELGLQIETLGRVRERFPRAGLLIAGSGSLEAELRAAIAAQPWAEHILLCGDVPHEATLAAIARADVFLRTTLYDGDSVAVREALHLGTRVVATDTGMRPEGVRLIPKSDAEGLRRAIAECVGVPRAPLAREEQDNIEAVLAVYRELA
jgi:glycosyltransferase involved in cell wall biosynthesis